jgi:hypothetical protein
VKVELHFALANPPDPFHEAFRFVLLLTDAYHLVEFRSWRDAEGGLVDRLVAGIEFGHDEMAGGTEGQHAGGVRVVIGP